MRKFRDNIEACNLIDLGFSRPRFTWPNLCRHKYLILERLDRFLANSNWLHLFPDSVITHLLRIYSDHCPLTLNLFPNKFLSKSSFKLETMWLTHHSFDMLVHQSWPTSSIHYNHSINSLVAAAKQWKQKVFGNVFLIKRKKKLLACLNGIQKNVNYPSNLYLLKLENLLSSELTTLLNQEKQFWVLKSRINWLQHGDANTRFFHTSTLKKRRNNRIVSLRGHFWNWISGEISLTNHIFSHFSNLLSLLLLCHPILNYFLHILCASRIMKVQFCPNLPHRLKLLAL